MEKRKDLVNCDGLQGQWCTRQELNLHFLSKIWTWTIRVCQFRHGCIFNFSLWIFTRLRVENLGGAKCLIHNLQDIVNEMNLHRGGAKWTMRVCQFRHTCLLNWKLKMESWKWKCQLLHNQFKFPWFLHGGETEAELTFRWILLFSWFRNSTQNVLYYYSRPTGKCQVTFTLSVCFTLIIFQNRVCGFWNRHIFQCRRGQFRGNPFLLTAVQAPYSRRRGK